MRGVRRQAVRATRRPRLVVGPGGGALVGAAQEQRHAGAEVAHREVAFDGDAPHRTCNRSDASRQGGGRCEWRDAAAASNCAPTCRQRACEPPSFPPRHAGYSRTNTWAKPPLRTSTVRGLGVPFRNGKGRSRNSEVDGLHHADPARHLEHARGTLFTATRTAQGCDALGRSKMESLLCLQRPPRRSPSEQGFPGIGRGGGLQSARLCR